MQPRKLGLKILLQIACGSRCRIALCEIQCKDCDRRNHQHHRSRQLPAETCNTALVYVAQGDHGKSTCTVAPLFNSTDCSRVVLLSIHAFSTQRPAGSPLNSKRPSGFVTTK